MSGNESNSSDRERRPSLVRSNNNQERRSKEVSPKVEEPLKEHPERKRPRSCSKSSNDRSTDGERSPSPKGRSRRSKKRHRSTIIHKVYGTRSNSALRENSNFFFSRAFCQYWQNVCFGGGAGHWAIILWGSDTFLIFPNFLGSLRS